MTCNQANCNQPAAYRFTWPGRDESLICEKHVAKLRGVAAAMGMHLQVIPLREDDAILDDALREMGIEDYDGSGDVGDK